MVETESRVEYRMLAGAALLPLIAKMSKQGEPIPNLPLTIAFVAEVDGEIVSHVVLQSLPVLEPVHSEPEHTEHLKPLIELMKQWVTECGAARVIVRTSEGCILKRLTKDIPELVGKCFDWRREDHV